MRHFEIMYCAANSPSHAFSRLVLRGHTYHAALIRRFLDLGRCRARDEISWAVATHDRNKMRDTIKVLNDVLPYAAGCEPVARRFIRLVEACLVHGSLGILLYCQANRVHIDRIHAAAGGSGEKTAGTFPRLCTDLDYLLSRRAEGAKEIRVW